MECTVSVVRTSKLKMNLSRDEIRVLMISAPSARQLIKLSTRTPSDLEVTLIKPFEVPSRNDSL